MRVEAQRDVKGISTRLSSTLSPPVRMQSEGIIAGVGWRGRGTAVWRVLTFLWSKQHLEEDNPLSLMYSASCWHPNQGLALREAGFSFSKVPPRYCSMATECLVAVLEMKHKPFLCVAVSKE